MKLRPPTRKTLPAWVTAAPWELLAQLVAAAALPWVTPVPAELHRAAEREEPEEPEERGALLQSGALVASRGHQREAQRAAAQAVAVQAVAVQAAAVQAVVATVVAAQPARAELP
jgi:hypothetical protein